MDDMNHYESFKGCGRGARGVPTSEVNTSILLYRSFLLKLGSKTQQKNEQ